jgi:hypothetical protein
MRAFILPAILAVLFVQAPTNPDDYVGDEDPAHKGQPKSCSNSPHIKAVKHDCKCEKKTPEACQPGGNSEDRACYVYCRKPACKCHHAMCETE